eukprot:Pgem_evm2s19504
MFYIKNLFVVATVALSVDAITIPNADQKSKIEKACTIEVPANLQFQNLTKLSSRTNYFPPSLAERQSLDTETCEPAHLTVASRHGSRYDGLSDDIKLVLNFVKENKANFSDEHLELFGDYVSPGEEGNDKLLIERGMYESAGLGNRLREELQNSKILKDGYNAEHVQLMTGYKSRAAMTLDSIAHHLYCGQYQSLTGTLTNGYQPLHIEAFPEKADYVTHLHKICKKYVTFSKFARGYVEDDVLELGKTPTKYMEDLKNLNNKTYTRIATKIQKKFNEKSKGNITISSTLVPSIITACAEDIQINSTSGRWCSLLDEEDVAWYNLIEDASDYYLWGYHNETVVGNKELGAIILQNVVTNIEDPKYKVNVIGGHRETILPLMVVLGINEDKKVPDFFSDNALETCKNRKWRNELMSPMLFNIEFIVHECKGEEDKKIEVRVNEEQVILPACDDVFCSYNKFKEYYNKYLSLNWPEKCGIDSDMKVPIPPAPMK